MIYKSLFEALLFLVLVVVTIYIQIRILDKVEELIKPCGTEVYKKVEKCIGQAQWLVVFAGLSYIILTQYDAWAEPRAIDVYRGQTTIEINYEDNVPQDTTVVWKK